MISRGILNYIFALIMVMVLTFPSIAFSMEDRAYISLNRVGISKTHTDPYVVKKDDHLFGIIRKNYNASEEDICRIIKLVKRLNPQLKDTNAIYPGQRLLLPRKRSSTIAPPAIEKASNGIAESNKENGIEKYVVKRGDSISGIINDLGNSYGEIYRVLKIVKRLNPRIKNFNRIYPGQTLFLPSVAPRVLSPELGGVAVTIPEYMLLPTIANIVGRLQGSMIVEGNYCIPVPPSSEVTIDCSKVPVIVFPFGDTVLLDLSNRMPDDLRGVIESAWNTYHIVGMSEGEEIYSILERILEAADLYRIEKINRKMEIGDKPVASLFVGWFVSNKSDPRWPNGCAINFVKDRSDIFPLPIRIYAQRCGLDIIEIMDGIGITGDETVYQEISMGMLDSGDNLTLADSLIRLLGYDPVKGREIELLSGDGLSMSMKTELLLDIEGRRIILASQIIPESALKVLSDRGDRVVYISENMGKIAVIEDVLNAVGIASSREDFKFSFSTHSRREMGEISFHALRTNDNGDMYMIDYDVDKDIRELLHGEWKVKLVKY